MTDFSSEICEKEKFKLGIELHDGLCQQLTAIAMICKALAQKVEPKNSTLSFEIKKISSLVNETVALARDISRALYTAKGE